MAAFDLSSYFFIYFIFVYVAVVCFFAFFVNYLEVLRLCNGLL